MLTQRWAQAPRSSFFATHPSPETNGPFPSAGPCTATHHGLKNITLVRDFTLHQSEHGSQHIRKVISPPAPSLRQRLVRDQESAALLFLDQMASTSPLTRGTTSPVSAGWGGASGWRRNPCAVAPSYPSNTDFYRARHAVVSLPKDRPCEVVPEWSKRGVPFQLLLA